MKMTFKNNKEQNIMPETKNESSEEKFPIPQFFDNNDPSPTSSEPSENTPVKEADDEAECIEWKKQIILLAYELTLEQRRMAAPIATLQERASSHKNSKKENVTILLSNLSNTVGTLFKQEHFLDEDTFSRIDTLLKEPKNCGEKKEASDPLQPLFENQDILKSCLAVLHAFITRLTEDESQFTRDFLTSLTEITAYQKDKQYSKFFSKMFPPASLFASSGPSVLEQCMRRWLFNLNLVFGNLISKSKTDIMIDYDSPKYRDLSPQYKHGSVEKFTQKSEELKDFFCYMVSSSYKRIQYCQQSLNSLQATEFIHIAEPNKEKKVLFSENYIKKKVKDLLKGDKKHSKAYVLVEHNRHLYFYTPENDPSLHLIAIPDKKDLRRLKQEMKVSDNTKNIHLPYAVSELQGKVLGEIIGLSEVKKVNKKSKENDLANIQKKHVEETPKKETTETKTPKSVFQSKQKTIKTISVIHSPIAYQQSRLPQVNGNERTGTNKLVSCFNLEDSSETSEGKSNPEDSPPASGKEVSAPIEDFNAPGMPAAIKNSKPPAAEDSEPPPLSPEEQDEVRARRKGFGLGGYGGAALAVPAVAACVVFFPITHPLIVAICAMAVVIGISYGAAKVGEKFAQCIYRLLPPPKQEITSENIQPTSSSSNNGSPFRYD